jgi:hypothetical protein
MLEELADLPFRIVEFGFNLWLSHRGDDVPAFGLKMFGSGFANSAA